jgi:hypothetical protein
VIEGERLFSNAIKTPQDNQLNPKQDTKNGTSFTHAGVTVHVKFSEEGKGLNELLVNYFKSLN